VWYYLTVSGPRKKWMEIKSVLQMYLVDCFVFRKCVKKSKIRKKKVKCVKKGEKTKKLHVRFFGLKILDMEQSWSLDSCRQSEI
jgi:hypothetical protein